MMPNSKLMVMLILLWSGILPVASHYYLPRRFWREKICSDLMLPRNAVWKDEKRFTCSNGYQALIQTTCKHGHWKVKPSCQDCYKYTQNKFVQVEPNDGSVNKTQEECDVLCAENAECSSFVVNRAKDCLLFAPPIFFVSYYGTLSQCVDECTKLDECLSLSFVGDNRCFIFNGTLSTVNNTNPIRGFSGETIVEKICAGRG